MRKFLMSAVLAATVLSAAPAMAQYNGNGYPPPPRPNGPGYPDGPGYGSPGQISSWQLRQMVERAIQQRDISWQEGRDLRVQVNYIQQLEQRSRYGNGWQRGEIQRRTDLVLQRLRYSRHDGGRYGDDRRAGDDRRYDEDRRRDGDNRYDHGDGNTDDRYRQDR